MANSRRKPRYSLEVPQNTAMSEVVATPQNESWVGLLNAFNSKTPSQWTNQNPITLANSFVGAAFLAVNTLCNYASQSTCKVFERTLDPNDSDIELPWHDALCRILRRPNNEDMFSDLLYQIVQQISLTGMALIWTPKWQGQRNQLFVIPTASCYPLGPNTATYPEGAYVVQPYWNSSFAQIPSYQMAAGAIIDARDIIRVKNFHPLLKSNGYATLTAMSRSVDTLNAIDMARLSAQNKGMDPTLAITFDPKIYSPEQPDMNRLRVQLESMYSGPQNAGRILPTPVGSTVTKISNTPAECAFESGYEQITKFVLAAYGTPAAICGLSDSANYATLYATLKSFSYLSLTPTLQRIANKLNSDYIEEYFGDDLYCVLDGVRIDDEELQLNQMDLLVRAKAIKKNELRKVIGKLPPVSTAQGGDDFIDPIKETVSIGADNTNQASDAEQDADVVASQPKPTLPGSAKDYSNRLAEVLDMAKHRGLVAHVSGKDYID